MRPAQLSLRPGEWGERSQRISVLAAGSGWFVLEQPSPFEADSTEVIGSTESLQHLLRERLAAGSPSLESLGASGATRIYSLPCGGPIVFAGSREQLTALKADYGSEAWCFRFLLLSRKGPEAESLECDLPVAVHRTESRSLISHRTGKRARTGFRRLIEGSSLQLWEATTSYLRPDQIRLHAAEVGIGVAGETVYGEHEGLARPDLPGTRRPGGKHFGLLPGPALHLAQVQIPQLLSSPVASSPPKSFLKWIESQVSGEKDLQAVLNPPF